MRSSALIILLPCFLLWSACSTSTPSQNTRPNTVQSPTPIVTSGFSYPIGSGTLTQAKDKDPWYNALEFGENDHLGEDWNMNTGGNTDCGQPVFATADGLITYARDAGPGWGNVVIMEHQLPNGEKVETLYGHLQEILKTEGTVRKRDQIGKIGNANGRYLCHLHFEIRTSNCPMWNTEGPGYSSTRDGWTDPSDFIDSHR